MASHSTLITSNPLPLNFSHDTLSVPSNLFPSLPLLPFTLQFALRIRTPFFTRYPLSLSLWMKFLRCFPPHLFYLLFMVHRLMRLVVSASRMDPRFWILSLCLRISFVESCEIYIRSDFFVALSATLRCEVAVSQPFL